MQLIGIIIVFLIILAAAYAASVFVGRTQSGTYRVSERNMQLVETLRFGNGQFLQIVRIGHRYYALSVTKEHIELIAEIAEDELKIADAANVSVPFQDVLDKVKVKIKSDKKKNNKN